MAKWDYGDSWERYPITEGEVWSDPISGSKVSVCDLRDGLPDWMAKADMVYSDPPWNKGNANAFVTKAGKNSYIKDFGELMDALFVEIAAIGPAVCYLEIGKQHLTDFQDRMGVLYPIVQVWPITYYRRHGCFLVRGGSLATPKDFTGMDDEDAPLAATQIEHPSNIADPCTGRGLTMLATHRCGLTFYGTELNRRRLAVAIDRAAAMGVRYAKHPS